MKSWSEDGGHAENLNWPLSAGEAVSFALNARLFQSVETLALENRRLIEAAATAMALREHLNWELQSAREVQQRLFPQEGVLVAGLEYAGQCRPAESVGGDYYDFVPMHDGRLGLAVGDVSGKGVPAALLMASLQASLRGLAVANATTLSSMISKLNLLIYAATPPNRYATLFYGAYEPRSREFSYVNCGHNAAMLFRGEKVLRLKDGGSPIGMFSSAQYQQASIALLPEDALVLYSDGISEARNSAEQEFGDERLIETIRNSRTLELSELIAQVFAACDTFIGAAPQNDDMTVLIARVGKCD
jgi:sigma-B regulation protein RsbU (phosphoserine phosphatase)